VSQNRKFMTIWDYAVAALALAVKVDGAALHVRFALTRSLFLCIDASGQSSSLDAYLWASFLGPGPPRNVL
jgi:hypothetical protein